ncbi:MAG: TetR/AcrR family transcriptional regulator [Clostridiales bacterium]
MEVRVINKNVTSKEAILAICRDIAAKEGLESLNMRIVAEKANVAVGSVYNYFPSKAELITATIKEIWQGIFHGDTSQANLSSFSDYVVWIFERVKSGTAEYPNFFFAHSLSFAAEEKGNAREVMDEYFSHIKGGLLMVLRHDSGVNPQAFNANFTQKDFVDFVFTSLLSLFMKKDSTKDTLIEIIKRSIY